MERCEACEALLRTRGVVGACDHPFPGRPLRPFWVTRQFLDRPAGSAIGQVRIAIVRCQTWGEARALLAPNGERQINELTTPELVKAAADYPEGEIWETERSRTPSVYDQFSGYYIDANGTRRSTGFDYQAMEEAGFDVS